MSMITRISKRKMTFITKMKSVSSVSFIGHNLHYSVSDAQIPDDTHFHSSKRSTNNRRHRNSNNATLVRKLTKVFYYKK